jgi:thiol-disulfide isomerase/thioredoxin
LGAINDLETIPIGDHPMTQDTQTDGASGSGATSPASRPGLLRSIAHRLAGDHVILPVEGRLASFEGATSWLNSEPLTPQGLRGRVVLVDFWTYTCINWLRTLPYVKAWAAKYADAGLTVIGVHTPEFGFERTIENIVARSKDFGVTYPVAIDSDYGVWEAFSNHFWPAIYIADTEGRIRYHHFGEEAYAETEMVIQQLLLDAGADDVDQELVMVEPQGLEVAADWRSLRSPETYLGYGRTSGFASEDIARFDVPQAYPTSTRLALNEWAPAGMWTVARHVSRSEEAGARIAFRFQARDVNLVMGPATRGDAIPFRVYLDGSVASDAHGSDVQPDGSGVLDAQRVYQLIRQTPPIRERTFEIEFLQPGAEAYCFTFG